MRFDGLHACIIGWSAGSGNIVDCGTFKGTAGRRDGRLGIDLGATEFGEELVLIFGEALTFVKKLIEAADEGFVVRAETADDGAKARLDLVGIFTFKVVVDEDYEGKRKGFDGEKSNLLLDVVFKDAEFIFLEVGNEVAVVIFDGNGQHNESGIKTDNGGRFGRWDCRGLRGDGSWRRDLRLL